MEAQLEATASHKESLEAWGHAISNKFIYFCEAPESEFKGRPRFVDWKSEYKLGHGRLDIEIVLDRPINNHFHAIVEIARGEPIQTIWAGLEGSMGAVDRDRDVLVDIGKFVKSPEWVRAEAVPSIVRLKRLNDLDCLTGEIPGDTPEPLLTPLLPVMVDRKGGVSGRGGLVQQGELPRKVVQAGTKTIGKLSDKQRDYNRVLPVFKPDDVVSAFYIVVFRSGYIFRPKICTDFLRKSLKVGFPPLLLCFHVC